MPFFIFFLMISWPVLEVASIIQVSKWVGPLTTFLLLAAGFAFGAFLIRTQSRVVGMRVMEAMRTGAAPEKTLLDSGTVSLAGVLFMIPGFVSDAVAVLLLIPAVRSYMWRGVSYGLHGTRPASSGSAAAPRAGVQAAAEETEARRGCDRRGVHRSAARPERRRQQRQARRLALGQAAVAGDKKCP